MAEDTTNYTHTFHLYVSMLLPTHAEAIAGALVAARFNVEVLDPLSNDLVLEKKDHVSSFFSVRLVGAFKSKEFNGALTVAFEEVIRTLDKVGVKYFNVVLTQAGGAMWRMGNVKRTLEHKVLKPIPAGPYSKPGKILDFKPPKDDGIVDD